MYFNIIFHFLTILSIFPYQIHGKSVNSGCYSGNLGMDVFCQETGCSKQPGGGANYEPNIMKYQSNGNNVMMNFICKQAIDTNEGVGTIYNVVYSDEKNEFMVPITQSDDKQYWYGPRFEVSESGAISLSFSNLGLLDSDDTITIIREDNTICCEIYFESAMNDIIFNYVAEPNQTYRVRVGMNFTNNVHYPECQNDVNIDQDRTHSEHYTVINEISHFKRNVHHHLLQDYLSLRVSTLV